MIRLPFPNALLAVALVAVPGAALAQQAETGQTPKRIRNVTLTGAEQCPKAEGDEIVVCNKLDEPYRIPKALRNDTPIAAKNQSWVNRAAVADQVGRVAGGLPDTCSPVGSGGQTGCALAWNRAYAEERRAKKDSDASTPGGPQ